LGNKNRTLWIVLGIGSLVVLGCVLVVAVGGLLVMRSVSSTMGGIMRGLTFATPRPGEVGAVYAVAVSPDGHTVAAAYGGLVQDYAIRLWDVRQPQASPTVLSGHTQTVDGLAFSPDGQILASIGEDSGVRLWPLATPGVAPTPISAFVPMSQVAFSPDGRYLGAAGSSNIWLWEMAASGGVVSVTHELAGYAKALAFSPDGRIVAGAAGESVQLWDLGAATPVATMVSIPITPGPTPTDLHTQLVTNPAITSVAFSPDGRLLATGSYDGGVRIWERQHLSAAPLLLRGHPYTKAPANYPPRVDAIAFSPNGQYLASANAGWAVLLWSVGTPTAAPRTLPHEGVDTVAVSPDGRLLVSGSLGGLSHGTVQVWDLQQLQAAPLIFPDPATYPYQDR
jgi:WD40 repeat protein